MKVFLAILCMISLFSKIKGFKYLFKSSDKIQEEFEKPIQELKDKTKNAREFEIIKGVLLIIYWMCGIVSIGFYTISMFYFPQILIVVFGCVMLMLNIKGYYNGTLAVIGKGKLKNEFMYKILSYTYLGIIFYNLYINW